jgi:gelsolin
VEESILKREFMDTKKCYMIDCGREIFMWVGRDTQLEERKTAAFAVQVKR